MREELFWDTNVENISPEKIIQRAINFGGFDFVESVQKKYGLKKFKDVLKKNKNLSKKAVNYWCLKLKLDRNSTQTFQSKNLWNPFR